MTAQAAFVQVRDPLTAQKLPELLTAEGCRLRAATVGDTTVERFMVRERVTHSPAEQGCRKGDSSVAIRPALSIDDCGGTRNVLVRETESLSWLHRLKPGTLIRALLGFDQSNSAIDRMSKIARNGSPVLLVGEPGTGKGVLAQTIHKLSGRPGSFMPVDCREHDIADQLFGVENGHGRGTNYFCRGLLEQASGGTLFLDGVGSLNSVARCRLTRFIADGTFGRLGGSELHWSDVRVVASSNLTRSGRVMCHSSQLELLFGLCANEIELKPLRSRRDDIPRLLSTLLSAIRGAADEETFVSDEVIQSMVERHWPGNLRQFAGCIADAARRAQRVITLQSLPGRGL